MPRRSLHNPEFDDRPAYGLRDDALDDEIRARTSPARLASLAAYREAQRLRGEGGEDDDTESDDDEQFEDEDLGPQEWRPANRVTNTEVALFLANALLRGRNITSNVNCFLSGYELTRNRRRFDVEDFLTRKFGFLPKARAKGDWRGNYSIEGTRHKLVLKYDKLDPCITVRIRGRRRIVCFIAGGRIASDGQAEKGIVRDLAGRAVGWAHGDWSDVLIACVPRSEHFRKTIAAWRSTNGTERLRLNYVMVERTTGTLIGLDEILNPVYDD
jgi:hypothetical protein